MTDQFYIKLDELFSAITEALNNYSNSEVLQEYFIGTFESFFYANLINNFFLNLIEQNLKDYDLSSDDISRIKGKYEKIQENVKSTLAETPFGKKLFSEVSYDNFKVEIQQDFPGAFELISAIETQIDLERAKKYLKNKAEEIKKTGKPREDFHFLPISTALEVYVTENKHFPAASGDFEKVSETLQEALPEIAEHAAKSLKDDIDGRLRARRQELLGVEARRYARWKEPLDLFECLIRISERAGEKHKQRPDPSTLKTYKAKFTALVKLHVRACRVSKEILVLLAAGYPDGAFARWRTLRELAVVSVLLSDNDETLSQRYLEHQTLMILKEANDYQNYHSKLGYPPIDKTVLDNLRKERDRLIKKYGNEFKTDWGWASCILPKPTFTTLARKAKLDHLQPFFRLSSAAVHGLSRGFHSLGLMADSQDTVLLSGPSNYGLADTLQNASISLHQITFCLLNFEVDPESLVEGLIMDSFVKEIAIKAVDIQKAIEEESSKPK
jgi:hypothetical protein